MKFLILFVSYFAVCEAFLDYSRFSPTNYLGLVAYSRKSGHYVSISNENLIYISADNKLS